MAHHRHPHKDEEKGVGRFDVEDDREGIEFNCPCQSGVIAGTILCLACFVCLLLVTMVPASFSYVEYNQYAFKKNTISNYVDQSKIYENGRYNWGLARKPLTFPSTYQKVIFRGRDLLVFSETGLEFSLECDIYYRLNKTDISKIFTDFGTAYHDRFVDAMRASIKNTAPEFKVDEYITNRNLIEERMRQNLNEDLLGLHIQIDKNKFMLRRAIFPDKIRDIFLKTSVQELNNDKSILEQNVTLITKETEEQVQRIRANITIVEQVANATADANVKKGESEAIRILQEATGTGLKYLISELNVTNEMDRARLFRLLAIMDNTKNPKILVGDELKPLISING